MTELKPGIYRHNKKNNLYRVIGVAENTETEEQLVLYSPLETYSDRNHTGQIWARPVEMFTEMVELDGVQKPRFEFVEAA